MTIEEIKKKQGENIKHILLRNFDNDKYLWSGADKELKDWHATSIKQILEALVDRENEIYDNPPIMLIYRDAELRVTWNQAKQDTISHLQSIIKTL